jgi:hypothetical protein
MTDQLETYLRDRFAADAERAPLAHDLAVTARRRAQQQRRRAASLIAAGLIVPAVLAGLAYGLGGTTRTAAPPAQDSTSASPAPNLPPLSSRLPDELNAWLEQPNPYTADIAIIPWGGRMYCETTLISASPNADDLYVWALCTQVYVKDAKATIGSAKTEPVVMHVTHHVDTDGTLVVDRVNGIDYPHYDNYFADIARLFPTSIVDGMRSGQLDIKPSQADLLARAQADVDAGRLGTSTDRPVPAAAVARLQSEVQQLTEPAPGTPAALTARLVHYQVDSWRSPNDFTLLVRLDLRFPPDAGTAWNQGSNARFVHFTRRPSSGGYQLEWATGR